MELNSLVLGHSSCISILLYAVLYPFNCQIVVEWQQSNNHSNLGILGDGSYIIHQMHTVGFSGSCEKRRKGCICARGKDIFFAKGCDQCHCVYWVRWVVMSCQVCLACLCLVACIDHWSDSPCVSCDHPWLPVDLQRIQHRLCMISASPSSAEASESRSKHDWMHRVGSRRWLELATDCCSDPPTDAQRNCNTHALSCTNLRPLGDGGATTTW